MRKFTAVLLVLVIVFSLFGCQKSSDDSSEKSSCTVPEMLVAQAVTMAQQLGLSAKPAYLGALDTAADAISQAGVFQQVASSKPTGAKSFSVDQQDFPRKITELCGKFATASQVAASGMLTFRAQISLPKTLEATTAVILQYGSRCAVIVVFEPLKDKLVSAWTYPLFPKVAERVLAVYGEDAEDWGASQVTECCQAAADIDFSAKYTGKTMDADDYAALATSVFANVKTLNSKQVSQYTTVGSIVEQVVTVSKLLSNGITETQVYNFPAAQDQIDKILATADPQLSQLTAQRVYLAMPNKIANAHGAQWMAASSILNALLQQTRLGATAAENEAPVLVLLGLSDQYSIVMSIYPSQHNTYLYSFSCLPLSFSDAQARMKAMGATVMQ